MPLDQASTGAHVALCGQKDGNQQFVVLFKLKTGFLADKNAREHFQSFTFQYRDHWALPKRDICGEEGQEDTEVKSNICIRQPRRVLFCFKRGPKCLELTRRLATWIKSRMRD